MLLAVPAYPLLVYGGLRLLTPRVLALALGAVFVLREALQSRQRPSPLLAPLVIVMAICAAAAIFNDGRVFLYVPALINGVLLLSFVRTLVVPPSMGERLARRRRPELSAEDVAYCRRVTEVWCVFFVANGAFSVWLAARGALETWTVYNGLVSYVLVGVLFVGEMVYRAWHFRRFEGDVTDAFLRKVFPPKPAR
jgi:uncharacterized membrane protein